MKKKLSIHDIAKQLEVSAATISYVLNGKAQLNKIRPEIADKIKAYVKEVGYRPNLVAKSLRTGKSKIIGMLVEGISDYFFASIARIVEEEAYKAGYKLFYSSTDGNPEKARALINAFRERQVDGYIIAPTPGIEEDIQGLLDDHSPVILFDRYLPALKTTNVVINNYKGTLDAVTHLYENSYCHVGFVTLSSDQVQMHERFNGYDAAVKQQGKAPSVLKLNYSLEQSEHIKAIKGFIEAVPLDAILFATNYLTFAGLQAIKALKRTIPDDVAVVSFDDNNYFTIHTPSVSAIAQPVEAISHEIIKQLNFRLNGTDEQIKEETIVLEPQLIVRASSLAKKTVSPQANGTPGKEKLKPKKIS